MPDQSISFSKIVPTPSDTKWSQVYSAGSLFAVLALGRKQGSDADLKSIGKEILNNVEAEFFTLEEKTLVSIKEAAGKALASLPHTVTLSFCLGFVKDQVLYLVIAQSGQALMKRGEKIGVILKKKETVDDVTQDLVLESASGRLANNDLLMLQTSAFATIIEADTLHEALSNPLPTDVAETLSPHVHSGDAAAIIISYKEAPKREDTEPAVENAAAEQIEKTDTTLPVTQQTPSDEPQSLRKSLLVVKNRFPVPVLQLPPGKKRIAVVGMILVVILFAGVFLTLQKRNDDQTKALFAEAYTSAQNDYDEGMSLISLNKTLARDDFLKAKKTLEDALGKLPKDSDEAKQTQALLTKIDEQLEASSGMNSIAATPVDADENMLLATVEKDKAILAAVQSEDTVYTLTNDAVSETTDGKTATLFENDDDWDKATGIGTFGTNMYVLDTSDGVWKFTPSGNTYTKSAYFTGDAPSMTNAISMTIDGSVWILMKDGTIRKFTRGSTDAFNVSGLETPLTSPTKIVTNEEMDYLYILDNGNQRIVKLDKTGAFEAQFTTGVLKNAREMAIASDEKTAFVLSDGKFYSLPLN